MHVARIGRMSFQELFSVDDMEHAEGWRKLLCNKYFSTVVTLLCGFILTKVGYSNIWPLFGSANQLLSALVLITLCANLPEVTKRREPYFVPTADHHRMLASPLPRWYSVPSHWSKHSVPEPQSSW